MSDIVTIVTAFMDIGRGNWTGVKNNHVIPSYIKRDTNTYFERFERLCKIKNPIIVFTHSKYFEQLKKFRDDLFLVAIDTVFEDHSYLMKRIKDIQNHSAFVNFVDRPGCPEHWSTEYATITNMKSFFVNYAVDQKIAESDTYAWIDFGYVRDDTFCPPGLEWKFDTEGKINLFALDNTRDNILTQPIFNIVKTGEVYIQGCHVIAPKAEWALLKELVVTNLTKLIGVGLIDDDQTLFLMAYRDRPDKFKINYVPSTDDWFMIFRNHNHASN